MIAPIVETVTVAVPPDTAFDAFVRRLGEWWPREYTWSGETLERIGIEAHTGGMCYELGPHGFRCDWGRVLELAPPGASSSPGRSDRPASRSPTRAAAARWK